MNEASATIVDKFGTHNNADKPDALEQSIKPINH
jgi:hypothetical protein